MHIANNGETGKNKRRVWDRTTHNISDELHLVCSLFLSVICIFRFWVAFEMAHPVYEIWNDKCVT